MPTSTDQQKSRPYQLKKLSRKQKDKIIEAAEWLLNEINIPNFSRAVIYHTWKCVENKEAPEEEILSTWSNLDGFELSVRTIMAATEQP